MADEKPDPTSDPIGSMFTVDNEAERAERAHSSGADRVSTDAPADKPAVERDEQGKFKGKEGEKAVDKAGGEKEPDPKADVKQPEIKPAEQKRDDNVPLAKHLAEKGKLKAELEARDITIKQFEQRMAALEAKLAPKAEVPPEPDFVEDPKGYVDHKLTAALKGIEEANKKADESGKKAEETAAATAEQQQQQRFFADLQQHETRFIAANPDYYDALAHIRGIRAAQMREFDPEVTEADIVAAIRQEESQLAIQLARQGRDPVQTAYNLAKHFGYVKKAGDAAAPSAPIAKLPDPPANKRLPPDQTLGSGAGGGDESPLYKEGEKDPIDDALASLRLKRA